ncbi:DVU_2496 family lipoprotein [Chitinibacter sp. GC72]|uniref:DVU_2496 family lipoprotein n=1 Tax=Chitinibacter sp. GC72 TaxID=1526917 RepID=UPI0012F99AC4|nr:DVU_2496 family lipoprotein [Chitinibacter sp. GC72]
MKTIILAASFAALLSACGEPKAQCGVYAIGPNQIKEFLKENKAEPAPGRTEKAKLPADFPAQLLDKDGYYRGMQVFCKIDEAKAAISSQGHQDWGVYELNTEWDKGVYLADDQAYHLKDVTIIKQAVE